MSPKNDMIEDSMVIQEIEKPKEKYVTAKE
jgi:hypothetical protein